jgi:hypothetical protein
MRGINYNCNTMFMELTCDGEYSSGYGSLRRFVIVPFWSVFGNPTVVFIITPQSHTVSYSPGLSVTSFSPSFIFILRQSQHTSLVTVIRSSVYSVRGTSIKHFGTRTTHIQRTHHHSSRRIIFPISMFLFIQKTQKTHSLVRNRSSFSHAQK